MSGRDPELPILEELGAEFEGLIASSFVTVDPLDRHTVRRRLSEIPSAAVRERRSQARRVGRRAVALLALVCLVGGVAFAALRGQGGEDPGHGVSVLLGRAPDGAWTLSAYRDEGRLCTVFAPRGGELGGACGRLPGAGRVRSRSAVSGGRRYVYGVAGEGVRKVSVSLLGAGARKAVLGDVLAAPRDGGRSLGRWFVVELGAVPRGSRGAVPAVVVPLLDGDLRAGSPYVDCSLGHLASACLRRIESGAGG